MTTEKLTEIEEAFTRLSMLEYVAEIIMANQLAASDATSAEQAKVDIVKSGAKGYGPLTTDVDVAWRMQAMNARLVEMLARFVEKVARREREIRMRLDR